MSGREPERAGRAPCADRLDRLRARLAEAGLAGLVSTHPPNVRYLSGFTGSSGLLAVLPERVV
ncbi:MAG TPA: aminopeptidase P family N-terminal domain-containing protein, partial [Gemmatimonadota bacterium]|nr:aminopeptidase P family N-terminal domain-containing protein [Gemmatimonadota bacterium]